MYWANFPRTKQKIKNKRKKKKAEIHEIPPSTNKTVAFIHGLFVQFLCRSTNAKSQKAFAFGRGVVVRGQQMQYHVSAPACWPTGFAMQTALLTQLFADFEVVDDVNADGPTVC